MNVSTPEVEKNVTLLEDLVGILPGELARVLQIAARLANDQNRPLCVVGGVVRDAFLKRPSLDLDLMVEAPERFLPPSEDPFLAALKEALGAELLIHDTFRTAVLKLPSGFHIDVAQAREETYSQPGALPDVKPGTFLTDLHRRDFTINAMAIRLEGDAAGTLIDPTGGLQDLQSQRVKVIHSLSFVDDPTRLFRGIRFIARLAFDWSEDTRLLANIAFAEDYPERLSSQRLGHELDLLTQEPSFPDALISLGKLGGTSSLDVDRVQGSENVEALKTLWLEGSFPAWRPMLKPENTPSGAIFLVLLGCILPWKRKVTLERWGKVGAQARKMLGDLQILQALNSMDIRHEAPSVMIPTLRRLGGDGWHLFWARLDEDARQRLEEMASLFDARVPLSGGDLIQMGVKPGPGLGQLLAKLSAAFLDGEFQDKSGGLKRAKELIGDGV